MNTNDYCNQVDATAERGGLAFRAAGLVLALLGGIITAGAVWTLGSIVWGWIS